MDEFEIIDAYTREQALEDGFNINLGKVRDIHIDITQSLFLEAKEKPLLIPKAIVKVMDLLTVPGGIKDLQKIKVGETELLVTAAKDEKGNKVITIMMPFDY